VYRENNIVGGPFTRTPLVFLRHASCVAKKTTAFGICRSGTVVGISESIHDIVNSKGKVLDPIYSKVE
jgi:hypothetical protein